MKKWIIALIGEARKQKQNYFNSPLTYISCFVWPVLNCVTSFYIYAGFDISKMGNYGISSKEELILYVFTGLLCYNSFWLMVQSALYIQMERENGTIEITFASPANKMAILYGRALGSVVQNLWMIIGFVLVMIIVGWKVFHWEFFLFAIILLLFSSTVWGGFINAIFLISRDTNFWFDLFDSPMDLLAGTKIPIKAFPVWVRWASFIFPLTYCIVVVRKIIIDGSISMLEYVMLTISLLLTMLITWVIVSLAYKKNRETGGFQLY